MVEVIVATYAAFCMAVVAVIAVMSHKPSPTARQPPPAEPVRDDLD
jgi:hypothetical protein